MGGGEGYMADVVSSNQQHKDAVLPRGSLPEASSIIFRHNLCLAMLHIASKVQLVRFGSFQESGAPT